MLRLICRVLPLSSVAVKPSLATEAVTLGVAVRTRGWIGALLSVTGEVSFTVVSAEVAGDTVPLFGLLLATLVSVAGTFWLLVFIADGSSVTAVVVSG